MFSRRYWRVLAPDPVAGVCEVGELFRGSSITMLWSCRIMTVMLGMIAMVWLGSKRGR